MTCFLNYAAVISVYRSFHRKVLAYAGYNGIPEQFCKDKGCCYNEAPTYNGASPMELPACFRPNAEFTAYRVVGNITARSLTSGVPFSSGNSFRDDLSGFRATLSFHPQPLLCVSCQCLFLLVHFFLNFHLDCASQEFGNYWLIYLCMCTSVATFGRTLSW
jgi:hypothetical protein